MMSQVKNNIIKYLEKETFDNVGKWLTFIKNVKAENALIVLCGNKIDLER
jgi:GTPase SAR1 family protein